MVNLFEFCQWNMLDEVILILKNNENIINVIYYYIMLLINLLLNQLMMLKYLVRLQKNYLKYLGVI